MSEKLECCEECGATDNLQEHHISYEPEIKQILCVSCHQKEHPNHGVGCGRDDYLPIRNEHKQKRNFSIEYIKTICRDLIYSKEKLTDFAVYIGIDREILVERLKEIEKSFPQQLALPERNKLEGI